MSALMPMAAWRWLHTWSSLLCTAFLLMLCLTGLPLIFHHEIDDWLDDEPPPPVLQALPPGTPRLPLDAVIARATALAPESFVRNVTQSDEPPLVHVSMGVSPEPARGPGFRLQFDARTAALVADSRIEQAQQAPKPQRRDFMDLMHGLHTDLFAGLAGELLLCAMGVLFVAAIVSGAVLYGPFMCKLEFGTVRADRSARLRWLDLHNLLGIVVLAWTLVVGATGVFHTLVGVLFEHWSGTTVRAALAQYEHAERAPVTQSLSSLQAAIDLAHATAPGARVGLVMFPNRDWVSPDHYFMFAWGRTPATARMRTIFLIDARSGALSWHGPFPWYLRYLDMFRALHFGDYAGLPLKIIWAVLDLITVSVLGSGLYLWLARRRRTAAGAPPARLAAQRPGTTP